MRSKLSPYFIACLALVLCVASACGKRGETQTGANNQSSTPTAPAPPRQPQTPFERDMDYVRKGQFTYVLIFSRKDGGVFDKDDVAYLKANSPAETNQWISTDEGRKVIAGSNFEFKPEHLSELDKRFNIQDYSGK
ncbi:MAG: hypothetical protein JO360_04580 [Acidobacteria bacterium]|nr:hypothetical protein [Acidobacteriota bacterium]